MQYELEIKQIVEYPKIRIYRNFIRELMKDTNIKILGGSYLFYFTVLCSFANFRTSYKKIDGVRFLVYPGEWICSIDEIKTWFRAKSKNQVLNILDFLQGQHYIEYSILSKNKYIKFKIKKWKKSNTVLEYNAPCQKDTGFFFLSHAEANELISIRKCSEMDIILDLWLNTIYNDTSVLGSDTGPVVYIRDGSGNPMLTTTRLAERYSLPRSAVNRILNKFNKLEYIDLITYKGRTGSVIYLKNYLSTMFNISDVIVDKEEVRIALNININTNKQTEIVENILEEHTIKDEQISVSEKEISIPFSYIKYLLRKVVKTLMIQGFSCCECRSSRYKLSKLSDCTRDIYLLKIYCGDYQLVYTFEISIKIHRRNRKCRIRTKH